jgi:DNA-binding transcriptional MerR regulator
MAERQWRIGELATATGLTVRALHHYDDIGLLVPSERSDAGHRLYGERDVRRLYLIVTLRELGMPLAAIADQLAGEFDARSAIAAHLDRLERDLDVQRRLHARVKAISEELAGNEEPSADDLVKIMEVISMHEKYFDADQLSQLEERRDALGHEAIEASQREWADLIAAVEVERSRGTDPSDAPMQELARKWQSLIDQFTGGDPGIMQSLKTMYETEGPEKASRGMVDPELMAYMGRAIEASKTTE